MPTHYLFCFFFPDPATTEIYTLSLHDALPISVYFFSCMSTQAFLELSPSTSAEAHFNHTPEERGKEIFPETLIRSEEHTSELQSRPHLVCRLLLEKKKIEQKRNETDDIYLRTK